MYKLHYVVDVDIKGFFDNVNHGKLLNQLATMISEDVSKISYEIQHKCKSRKLERRIE